MQLHHKILQLHCINVNDWHRLTFTHCWLCSNWVWNKISLQIGIGSIIISVWFQNKIFNVIPDMTRTLEPWEVAYFYMETYQDLLTPSSCLGAIHKPRIFKIAKLWGLFINREKSNFAKFKIVKFKKWLYVTIDLRHIYNIMVDDFIWNLLL